MESDLRTGGNEGNEANVREMKQGHYVTFRYLDIAVHSRVASGTSASSSRGSISARGAIVNGPDIRGYVRHWIVLYANQPVTIAAGDGKLPRSSIFVLG